MGFFQILEEKSLIGTKFKVNFICTESLKKKKEKEN